MSDSHGGHVLGLANPETELQDDKKGHYQPDLNDYQLYLWNKIYLKAIKDTANLAGKDEIVLFHIGDPTQGNKYPNEQMTTRMADQLRLAKWNFMPWLQYKNVKKVRLAKGTSSHSFGEGSSEVLLEDVLSDKFPKVDIRTIYHGLANVSGIDVDYAHHGPGQSIRKWLEGNIARYYLRDIMMKEIFAGNKPPNLVLRGHFHSYIKEILEIQHGQDWYESMIVVVPSLCGIGDFARQITKSVYQITNGIIVFEIINGKIHETYKFIETLDTRTKESL
jgi:hypothetical protein